MYGRVSDPGIGPLSFPSGVGSTNPRLFRTVLGGIDPGNHRFRPRFVEVVDLCKDLIRGWDFIFPGWRWLYEPQVGDSTPCGVVSTPGNAVFIPGFVGV